MKMVNSGKRTTTALFAASPLKTPHSVWGVILAGLLMAPQGATMAQTQPNQAAQQKPRQQQAEEIIVTATKRQEVLKEVPGAVTALTGAQLEKLGVQEFRDFLTLVPGLALRDFGTPGSGTIIIRGLNTGAQQLTQTSSYYIDDTQFTASGFSSIASLIAPDPNLGDVARIEVLKGPQGTLYGANNLGGIIRVVSNEPDLSRLSGNLRAEFIAGDRGGTGGGGRGILNVPLVENKIGARISAFYRETPGFTDNVGTGAKNVNVADSYGGRVALRYVVSENFKVDVSGMIQDLVSIGGAGTDTRQGTTVPVFGRYQASAVYDTRTLFLYRIGSATATYDFGKFSWVTSGSYGSYNSRIQADYSNIYVPLFRALRLPFPAGTQARGTLGPGTDKYTAESRLVSQRLGPVEFMAGLYYTKEDSHYLTIVPFSLPSGALFPAPLSYFIFNDGRSSYEEYAGFANATYFLTETLDVQGGVRASHNTNRTGLGDGSFHGVAPINNFAPAARPTPIGATSEPITYLGTLRWRPLENISTFLRVATGYRPGGSQISTLLPPTAQRIIQPDSTTNYEGGVKGTLADGRVAFEVSGYHIDWDKIQLNTLYNGVVFLANAGAAEVDGFEASFQTRPFTGATFGGSFGYTDARITQIPAATTASVGAVAGDKLPLTPLWTAALTGDYVFDLGRGVEGTTGGTLRYQGDAPSGYPGDRLNTRIKIPSYTTFDLRGGLRYGAYRADLKIENLTNKFAYTTLTTNSVGLPVNTNGVVIRPRTFSFAVSMDF